MLIILYHNMELGKQLLLLKNKFHSFLNMVYSKECAPFLTTLDQTVLQHIKNSFEDIHMDVKLN